MSIGRGENTAIIQLKLKLVNYVNEHAGQEKQSRGFYIAKRWLMFDPDIPQDVKAEMLEWYSKTNLQQQEENKFEVEARKIRQEARAKIEALKNTQEIKKLEESLETSEIRRLKQEIAKWEKGFAEKPQLDNPFVREKFDEMKAKLRQLQEAQKTPITTSIEVRT